MGPPREVYLASLKHMWYVFWARGSPYGKLKNLAVKWCLNNKYWDFQLPKNTNIPRYEPSLNWLMFVSFLLPPIHIVLCFFLFFFFFSVAFLFEKHLNLGSIPTDRINMKINWTHFQQYTTSFCTCCIACCEIKTLQQFDHKLLTKVAWLKLNAIAAIKNVKRQHGHACHDCRFACDCARAGNRKATQCVFLY